MCGFIAPKIPNLSAPFIGVVARGGEHLRVVKSMENTIILCTDT